MMFQYFTRPDGKSIAINVDNIISICEVDSGGVMLTLTNGTQSVKETYLETVARLNSSGGCCR